MDNWVVYIWGLLCEQSCYGHSWTSLCMDIFLNFSWANCLGVEFWVIRRVYIQLNKDLSNHFQSRCSVFSLPPSTYESSICFTYFPAVGIVSLFNFSHFGGYVVVSYYGFNVHFLKTNDVEHSLITHISSLVKGLFKSSDF